MIMRRLSICMAMLVGLAVLGGCSSGNKVSVDKVRQAAAKVQSANCPLGLDVPTALRSVSVDQPVRLDSVYARVSKSDKPAADPIAEERAGVSALEAVAGAYIECDYGVGNGTLQVRLVATLASATAGVVASRTNPAIGLLAPQINGRAHLTIHELQSFLAAPPGPGEIKLVVGGVAVGDLSSDGGDAAMMVSSSVPELHDLNTFTGTLVNQLSL